MRDLDRTKTQLVEELRVLRERLEQLEHLEADRRSHGVAPPDDVASRLRAHQQVLMKLASSPVLLEADLEPALEEITEAAGDCLSVERTSVWLYDEDRSLIRCRDLFERGARRHSAGQELLAQDYPSYFLALAKERVIAAHDALRDARTREFSSSYLTPLGIGSLLDAPIRVGGRMIGVVCHEHVGPPRTWSQEEQSFAASIGDLASLAIASNQRRNDEQERRKLELKVQQAQKLESLGVLAGGIAHDFNNLLVGILGNAGLALDELSPGSSVHECIDDVQTAAKRAADLCHQLLAYSGKGKFAIGPVDLNELVREMGHLLELSLSKTAALHYDLAADLPAIEADATQIRQVVMNLITNASEALGDESGVVAIRTGTVECDREYLDHCHLGDHLAEAIYVFLEVSDTGCGMDEVTVHKIFDPFYTSKFTGRGLGLAAVQGIVRGHRGAVRIDTTPGKGTTFRVLLPRIARGAASDVDSRPRQDEWRGEGTVLLVDDDEAVRRVSRRMLERVGFSVVTAADGIEGVEQFERQADRIVAVVLDVVMPRMGGEKAFRELRSRRADVPIVLSSGFSEPEALASLGGDGRTGFVKKPYVAAQLVEKLREAMQIPNPSG